jgi:transcriptional regulator with XRE-family HTH domain
MNDRDERVQAGADLKVAMEAALSEKQMSVAALAREASVQRPDIYKWWRGDQRPSRNTLARVAKALDVDAAVLRAALGDPPSKVTPGLIDEIEARVRLAFREELRAALDELRETE